ncbi:MAG: polyprenyl synthetase family protein [Anaerolineae bacterium]
MDKTQSVDVTAALAPYLAPLDAALRAAVQPSAPALANLYGMLHYHLGWADQNLAPIAGRTGKRLRPAFCLLACDAVGGDWRQALPAAVGLELTHNFSLIHDDIEDGDRERHGRATVWTVWGEAQAINAGDALFVLARQALGGLAEHGVAPDVTLAVLRSYDAACLAITEGQFLDMQFEERLDVTEAEYLRMVGGKTAALLSACTRIGAQVAGADAALVEGMASFGRLVGLAFQMTDDILGIWGDAARTGKAAANDIRRRKKSLPIAFALETARGSAADRLRAIFGQGEVSEDDVAGVLAILDDLGARAHTQRLADEYLRQALAELAPVAHTQAGTILEALTRSLAQRER